MSESEHNSPVQAFTLQGSLSSGSSARFRSHVESFGECGYKIRLLSPNLRVELLSLGASINSVQVRDTRKPEGGPEEWLEVCLGFNEHEECENSSAPLGFTCGRYAGRISNGTFNLNGTEYKLIQNSGDHALNGSALGFEKFQWKYLITEGEDEIGVVFHLASQHLDQGFPGKLFVTATYTIPKHTQHPTLKYVYQANLSDTTPVSATVVNLINQTHWNLNGVPRAAHPEDICPLPKPIINHMLQLNSKYFADTDDEGIADGCMLPVEGTAHDYAKLRCIEEGMRATIEEGRELWGYDDSVALDTWDSTLREAAILYSPLTMLQMRLLTTSPVVYVHTANKLPADASGAKGQRFQQHAGICLGCGYFPNSPNVASFPSTTLKKGENYSETVVHEFCFLHAPPKV